MTYCERRQRARRAPTSGVVVVGEAPYAEFEGDRTDLALDTSRPRRNPRGASRLACPRVVVLLSGRPLILDEALDMADAFVAAWLPGTEGQGVADVLFGDYAPTGKLPVSLAAVDAAAAA